LAVELVGSLSGFVCLVEELFCPGRHMVTEVPGERGELRAVPEEDHDLLEVVVGVVGPVFKRHGGEVLLGVSRVFGFT